MNRHGQHSSLTPPLGLTLVEVLVALAISALALLAGLKLLTTTVVSLQESRLREEALRCADSSIVTLRLDPASVPLGEQTLSCAQSTRRLTLRLVVQPTAHLNFRRLEVSVLDAQEAQVSGRQGLAPRVLAQRQVFLPVGF